MGQYFKYKIDKVKFNNIKEHNFFEVYGWCYAQNVELISYEVKVNNKDVLFEIDSIYRSDVLKEIKINDKEKSSATKSLNEEKNNQYSINSLHDGRYADRHRRVFCCSSRFIRDQHG